MSRFRADFLASTFLTAVAAVAVPAHAQTAIPPPSANPPDNSATPTSPETTAPQEGQTTVPSTNAQGGTVRASQDIVITGTRIPQPNLTSASPVTVINSQEIKLQGTTRTEDVINSLPQAMADQGSNVSNGATGTAAVDLRGFGAQRTLVLVNGKRLMGGDSTSPTPDINFVPAPLIKRVDVLTGGASSVYGADAVAGVVNFIMDTNFRGLRIDAQASGFMHNNSTSGDILAANAARGFRPPHGMSFNGGAQDIAAAFGTAFEDNRGHIMAYATYRTQDPVVEASRDYSFCSLAPRREASRPGHTDPLASDRPFNCGGSGTSAEGNFFTNVGTFHVAGNQFVPGTTTFNFAPYNYYQRPDERYTLGAFADYEISPGAKPYLEAMFMNDRSTSAVAPSGDFANTGSINCDNPLLSAQQLALICVPDNEFVDANGVTRANAVVARRNVEGGPRLDDREHSAFRLVGGVRGDLLRGFSYDAYYQFGQTLLSDTFLNDMSFSRMVRSLDVVTNPTTVQPVCRSVLTGEDPACVPWNIFQTGGVTPEAIAYLSVPGLQRGRVQETIADANFTLEGGEYGLQTPWSDRGIGLNVGGEYRKESLNHTVDLEFSSGDLTGQGGPTPSTHGSFDVRELFGEVQVPIVSHSFIEDFTISGGYRYSDYKVADNHFSTNTYKIAAELAPVRDVRFRASYNRAVRAPNVVELFQPQVIGLAGSADPCAGPTPAATLDQCMLTGVTAAQYGNIVDSPGGQYNVFSGGNPNLKPESANTYTAGVVLQPRFIPGLAATFDYFNIKLKGAIGTIGFDTIMNQCITTGDPMFCSRIKRMQGNGSLWFFVTDINKGGYIVDINTNLGSLQTRGVDVQASYARRIGGVGNLNLSLVGTYVRNERINPIADIAFDCAGFYGSQCGTPTPRWRHKFRAGLTFANGIGVSGQWRYFAVVRNDVLSNDPDLHVPIDTQPWNHFPGNDRIKAQSYFDLTLTARLGDRYNVRIGANNIFDREPPHLGNTAPSGGGPGAVVTSPPFGNGNTFPQVYDALGRFVFAGVTLDF